MMPPADIAQVKKDRIHLLTVTTLNQNRDKV